MLLCQMLFGIMYYMNSKKIIYGVLTLFIVSLTGMPAVHAFDEGFVEASDEVVQDESDPSAFEGDSGDMPGERAPEDLPMDDAPVDAGHHAIEALESGFITSGEAPLDVSIRTFLPETLKHFSCSFH